MKKVLFSTLVLILSSHFLQADEVKEKTTEELIAEFMKTDEKIEKEKEKTKAVMKLGETVDKVAKKLGIEE